MALLNGLRNLPDSRVLLGAGVIIVAFLFGGGARADVTSLLWLRPISFVFLALALWTIRPRDLRDHKFAFAMAGAIVAVVALPLVPLPPSLWQALPGREIIVQVDHATALGSLWRPLTMTPSHTVNALHSLALPGALLLLLAQFEGSEVVRLVPVVAAMLGLSVGVGFLQAAGLPLHFYQIDNPLAGLFANRNHQGLAIACFFPMLAVLATRESRRLSRQARHRRHLLATAIGVTIIPLVFVTGSRAGLILAAMGILLAIFLLRRPMDSSLSHSKGLLVLSAMAVGFIALVGMVLVASDRNLAIQRLISKDMSEELRVPVWRTTIDLAVQYMPLGSGPGSFVEVLQVAETNDQLQPRYMNHAHNDFLEVALTSGIAGILLICLAVGAFAICAWRIRGARSLDLGAKRYRWLGLGLIAMCGAASVVDYPLRTPAFACLFVFAAFLATDERASEAARRQIVV